MIVSPLSRTLVSASMVSSTGGPAFTITRTARGGFRTEASSWSVAVAAKSPSMPKFAMNSSVRRRVRL